MGWEPRHQECYGALERAPFYFHHEVDWVEVFSAGETSCEVCARVDGGVHLRAVMALEAKESLSVFCLDIKVPFEEFVERDVIPESEEELVRYLEWCFSFGLLCHFLSPVFFFLHSLLSLFKAI